MKANELRIGNYVQFWGDKEYPSKVIGFNNRIVYLHFSDANYINPELIDCSPIPLTEEWLLKFGFEIVHVKNKHYIINDPNGYKDSHKISILQTLNNQWYIAFSDNLGGYKDYIPTTKIKYVHQLQNLYFALTNEELTMK